MSIFLSMYQSTIFGTSVRPRAAERRALPLAPGDELERTRRDLLPGPRDADDDGDTPAAVAALEGLAHELRVADALERVIGAALREIDEVRDEVALDLLRVHEVRHAELPAEGLARRVDVDTDDHVRADHPRALDDVEADAAEAEDDDVGARLHLRRVDDGADARVVTPQPM